jgi:hypothetical protein
MIVRLRQTELDSLSELTPCQLYVVIGIEADDLRLINDEGRPYLYPAAWFEIIDDEEPEEWITEYGDDGERYAYPPELNEPGFFEDYFETDPDAVRTFWRVINRKLAMLTPACVGILIIDPDRCPAHVVEQPAFRHAVFLLQPAVFLLQPAVSLVPA